MGKNDTYLLAILMIVPILVFYPLFYTDYLFMDEAYQIWQYNTVPGFYMFTDDGRWLTELLQSRLFKLVHSTHEVKYIRLISLLGWVLCLPVWYYVIKRLVTNVPVYKYLPFFTCLYLVTSLPFTVSVQWATCMQFFIAHTCGLLSGALLLQGTHFINNRFHISAGAVIISLALGIVSLFTYQSAFGCYLLPFLLHFISIKTANKNKVFITGLVFYFIIYAAYFGLYKWNLRVNEIPPYSRTVLYFAPLEKLKFFLARPLERSFRFTLLTNEDNAISKVYYLLMLIGLGILAFIRFGKSKWISALQYLGAIGCIFLLSYLPSLIVKESWASNRTQQALNICVFIVCFEMALYFIKNSLGLQAMGYILATFFILCARHNFRKAFLHPIQQETAAIKNYIQQNYKSSIQTIYFIRPSQDYVVQKYHVDKSMDELGVASTCWEWVPDSFTRQMVYETTGNRAVANQLVIKQWPDKQSYLQAGEAVTDNTLLIDVPAILDAVQP